MGKTTLLRHLYDEIESGNKIFLDLENLLNRRYFETGDYDRIADEFRLLGFNPEKKRYITAVSPAWCKRNRQTIRRYGPLRPTGIQTRSMPKFYLRDSGFINHFARVSDGALFENVVFSALRTSGEVNHYQRKSGAEIDFVLNKEVAYEVKNLWLALRM